MFYKTATRLAGTAETTAGTIFMKNSLVIFNVVCLSGIEESTEWSR